MRVIYDTENLDLSGAHDETLLQRSLRNKLPISHSCEGMASCGTCRVLVTKGWQKLPPRNPLEQEMADDRGFKDYERLACQLELAEVNEDFSFILPQDQEN